MRLLTIEDCYLVGYFDKKSGKLGSLRLAMGDRENLLKLMDFMKEEVKGFIEGVQKNLTELYRETANPKRAEIKEFEELLHYYQQIEVVYVTTSDANKLVLEAHNKVEG